MANSTEYWVVALYSGLAITGLLGNLWVLLSVTGEMFRCCRPQWSNVRCKPTMLCSATIYLLILSVVDLISMLPVPLLATDIIHNEWPFGLFLCKLIFFCEGANKSLSPLVLTALSADRYVAVCRATLVWLRRSKFALLLLLACFCFSLFFIMPVVYYAEINNMVDANYKEHPKCVVQMSRNFDIAHVFTCYLIPLLLICSVYVAILHRLYRHTHNSTVGRRTSISLGRVLKCSVFVVAYYFVCWTPYWALRIVAIIQEPSDSLLAIYDVEMVLNGSLTLAPGLSDGIAVATVGETNDDDEEYASDASVLHEVALMYVVHALPYAQSAFNWLFYAFLNRNLRHQSTRCGSAIRSFALTTTLFDITNRRTSANAVVASLCAFVHNTGLRLKNATTNTSGILLHKSRRWHLANRDWMFIKRAAINDVASEHIVANALNSSSDIISTSRNDNNCCSTSKDDRSTNHLLTEQQSTTEIACSPNQCLNMIEYVCVNEDKINAMCSSSSGVYSPSILCTVSEGSSVEWL